jgi:hypothetical protein
MIRCACLAALMLAGTLARAQQPVVVVRDAGPGPVGTYLETTLRKPTTRVIVADTLRVARDATYPGALVVIGKRAEVRGAVEGDVIVVGGDLFVKPGARIEGQAIAIGGGAYGTLLGIVREGLVSYRDFTFDVERTESSIELRYREDYVGARRSILDLPMLYGLRIPTYDRTSGVSLPVGPSVTIGRATVDLVATYRSQLGRIDPSARARIDVDRRTWLEGFAGRETRTNDDWINGVNSNSLNVLLSGRDERNWYRATGAWATINRKFETSTLTATYGVGASVERATAVRPGANATGGPWSFTGRKDTADGILRPNPQLGIGGDIVSAIGTAGYRWTVGSIKARLDLDVEVPVEVSMGRRFLQGTVDGRIDFPTFGTQSYRLELHAMATRDTAPQQRFAYLGGSGTLATDEVLLARGGDELVFIESRYMIPIPIVRLPLAGSPTFTFRHILGAAGVQRVPDFTQIVGVRLSVPFVRVQYLIDTETRKTKFSAGLSLSR